MQYLIGIDLGTTNIKALLFDHSGQQIAEARKPTPTVILPGGGAEYLPDIIWNTVSTLLRSIVNDGLNARGADLPQKIAGLAITGMGEAGVPLDADGSALYPAIAWFDPRTEPYIEWWRQTFGDDRMFAITNLLNQHIFTANKLLWLREHRPDVFEKTARWHCMPDFIAFRLTGCSAMDFSIASRTMLFDAHKRAWSPDLMQHAGIPISMLPPPVPSGTLVGGVTAQAADQTGLLPGTPVFAGGHDHICGALAGGIIEPNVVLDSSGTCEEVLVCLDRLDEIVPLGQAGFNVGYHTACGKFYASGGIPASGASVDWFAREFPCDQNATSEPGAHGLLFLPHLRGSSSPERDPVSRGAFLGIRAEHTRADFQQAVYEGVAYELRMCAERLLGKRPSRVVSIGGGTKNKAWLRVKSDLLGVPIEVPDVQEATALGAALLAGIGAGLYVDEADALRQTYRIGQRVEPDSSTRACYDAGFQAFKQLYPLLRPLNAQLEGG